MTIHSLSDGVAFGLHRVVDPAGSLPQAATRLDHRLPLQPGEVLLQVERINLDAASYQQIRTMCENDGTRVRDVVLDIIRSRGKMHNPVTGSGGMLIGTVKELGPDAADGITSGQRRATLVSLTATPLVIHDGLINWDGESEVIETRGEAILFARSLSAEVPSEFPANLSLAVFDVCGAPALTDRVLRRPAIDGRLPERLLILGGGKSASLSAAAARDRGVWTQMAVPTEDEAADLRGRDLADEILVADASDALNLRAVVREAGPLADVTIVCVNRPGCEHGAILGTRDGGAVVYFSMATELSAAALGAEALGMDVDLYIGSGYVPGHAEFALDIIRRHDNVREFFANRA